MARRRMHNNLQFDFPSKFLEYGTWDYISRLGEIVSPTYYALLIKTKGYEYAEQHKLTKTSTRVRDLFRHVQYDTQEFKQLSIEFDTFAKENSWVNDYYNFTLGKANYVEDPDCSSRYWLSLKHHYSGTSDEEKAKVARVNAWLREPMDYKRFCVLGCREMGHLAEFNEIKRDLPFVVGNLVMLRSQCIGTRSHDPFYRESKEIKEQERIGLIMEFHNETSTVSYTHLTLPTILLV